MSEIAAPLSSSQTAPDEAFELLKTFFTERISPRVALRKLRENTEIAIVIGGMVSCAVFRQGDAVFVERREARNPDFVFRLKPETVSILALQTPDDVGQTGLGVIKEMLAGNVQVEMPGGFMSVLRNGYLEVISSGGAPVMAKLGKLGFGSPAKILGLFKNLRR